MCYCYEKPIRSSEYKGDQEWIGSGLGGGSAPEREPTPKALANLIDSSDVPKVLDFLLKCFWVDILLMSYFEDIDIPVLDFW